MKLPDRLKRSCRCSETPVLASLTSAGVGGRASCLIEPSGRAALVDLLRYLGDEDFPYRVIGAGSNIIAGERGIGTALVATWRAVAIERFAIDGDDVLVRADAGAALPRLVAYASARGLSGAECLTGIPGTVGGAVVKNAGGRQGDIASALEQVSVVDQRGRAHILSVDECDFRYRSSALGSTAVVDAIFRLRTSTSDAVRETTSTIFREKAASQPLDRQSAGCVFKNPAGDRSAGQLLDDAGLKGMRSGGASISEKHANFMINDGNASSRDFDSLIRLARERVLTRFGVELELEIDRW